jgi:uncharacterized protein YjiS (DUF1127 family)
MNRRNLRGPRWSRLKHLFSGWHRHESSRRELMNLSDRTLQDIGLSRGETKSEASKLFWLP